MCTVSVAMLCFCCRWLRYLLLLISRARGGGKKKLGAFLHTRVWRRTCLDFALSRRKRRQRRGKNEEKMWELEGSLSLSHFAEEGVRFFFLVWPIFSLYLFICETVCWAHFSVPRCERNPFFPCGFFSPSREEKKRLSFFPLLLPRVTKGDFFQSRFLRP